MTTTDEAPAPGPSPAVKAPFPYTGPRELRRPVLDALLKVVDPEMAMSIVDVGLVYGVDIADDRAHVKLTMTSAACPVTEVIVGEVESELDSALPPQMTIAVEVVWEPPWTSERMSDRARKFMGW